MKERRITVRGIVFKKGRLLAQRLKPGSDGKIKNYWATPGGGLEPGESLYEGLRREMTEETGVQPKIGKLLFVQQYEDEIKEFIEFFFHIENPEDYHTIDLTKTSHGELEIEHVEFINPSEQFIMPVFLQGYDIANAVNSDAPVYISNNLKQSS
jgi:ADP-ribose pyrophosphatase YjhB (NUDIX family)